MRTRPRDRRASILAAARARFHRHGYSGTSLEDIAGDLGITAPALYRHFRGKDALYRQRSSPTFAIWRSALQRDRPPTRWCAGSPAWRSSIPPSVCSGTPTGGVVSPIPMGRSNVASWRGRPRRPFGRGAPPESLTCALEPCSRPSPAPASASPRCGPRARPTSSNELLPRWPPSPGPAVPSSQIEVSSEERARPARARAGSPHPLLRRRPLRRGTGRPSGLRGARQPSRLEHARRRADVRLRLSEPSS